MRKPPGERSTSSRCLPSWFPLTWSWNTQIQMYSLWKWLESYNNCTFSTWKDKFVFNLLFWIPNSFCTFHEYGMGGTVFLASTDGPSLTFYHSDFWTTFACPEKQSSPETFHCAEIFFIFQDFWGTCACPEKQCALNSLYWIYIFNHSEFWTTCACPEKQTLPRNFSLHWNSFIFQDFWGTCACHENSLSSHFHCI